MPLNEKVLGKFNNLSHTIRPKDHLVHVYEDQETLVDSVCSFIVPALTSGEGIVIIAGKENTEAFVSSLEKRSIDVSKARIMEQLLIFDAEETLKKIMTKDQIDTKKFEDAVGTILRKLNRTYSHVRAYGEIVSILWNRGDEETAIALEKLWNELAAKHSFSLLCGYQFDDYDASTNHPCYGEVCNNHTHMITPDGHLSLYKR